MKLKLISNLIVLKLALIFVLSVFVLSTFFTLGDETQNDVLAQVGGQCRFDQASCSWDAVSGASNYSLTITEEETNTIIKQETVSGSTTKYVFPITANRTYRCDVSAVNECGTLGPAGSASALCVAEGVATPAPATPPPATPPPPTPTPPPPTPRPQVGCGSSCTTQADCQAGLTCIRIGNESYCAKSEYQAACIQNPTIASCCQPPQPKPTPPPVLPKTGLVEDTLIILLFGVAVAILGFGGILLTTRKRG